MGRAICEKEKITMNKLDEMLDAIEESEEKEME